jgi:hypothetical protein
LPKKKSKKQSPEPNSPAQQDDIDLQYRGLLEARVRAQKARFLQQFKRHKVVAIAARRIGVDRRTVYKWTADDAEFKEDLVNLQEEFTDQLEKELIKLATGQYTRPLVSAGKLVTFEEIHDTRALEMLLKAYRPRLYRERTSLEVSGNVGQQITITKKEVTVQLIADVTKLLAEQGLGSNDPPGQGDTGRDQGQSVDSALALAKASRLPKSAA